MLLEENKLKELIQSIEENVDNVGIISDKVVSDYSNSLDSLMQNIYTDVIVGEDNSTETLERYFLELTNTLYFMSEKLEKLGMYDDMSKASAKESYNTAYLNSQSSPTDKKKTTVAESQAIAEGASIYESTVNQLYSRSYKIFKGKIDAGYEMVKCLSKILSHRIAEFGLTQKDTSDRQILIENQF